MKKFLLPLFLILSFAASSQTLTQSANEPTAGDQESNFNIDTSMYASGLPINVTGSGAVWDYTHLQARNPAFITTYDDPASVSSSTDFPGCTVVQNATGLFTYIKSTTTPTTQTEILGISSFSLLLTFTNTAIAAKYPMSFGSTVSDNIAGNFSAFSYSGTCSGSITTAVDGSGTLMLPNGITINNVLRVKSVQKINLNQGFIPLATVKQTIYNYYDNTHKFPVLSVNYNSTAFALSSPTVSAFVTGNSSLFTASGYMGLKNNTLSAADVALYPLPFADDLAVTVDPSLRPEAIRIYSQLGQLVHQQPYAQSIHPSLPSGAYVLEITTAQGSIRKKLIRE